MRLRAPAFVVLAVGLLGAACDSRSPTEGGGPPVDNSILIDDPNGLLTAVAPALRVQVASTIETAGRALPVTGVTVRVVANTSQAIPGYGFGGRTFGPFVVELYVDPSFPSLAALIPELGFRLVEDYKAAHPGATATSLVNNPGPGVPTRLRASWWRLAADRVDAVRRRLLLALALLACLGLATACGSLGYYAQAVGGGLEIVCKRRPIARLLADPGLESGLRERLRTVLEMRQFAVAALSLPDNGSYRSYARLGRPFATWTVVVAPELSLAPHEWCFPVAGCVTYRGYFSRPAAERFAAKWKQQGYDVDLGGVAAFSTLGWLDDPVLDTFVELPETDLAGLLFHELAHQVVYVGDDTAFNESFATAVERAGVERWLVSRGRAAEIAAYRAGQAREEEVGRLVGEARERLAAVYAAPESDEWKRREKAEVLADLAAEHRRLAASWGQANASGWFGPGLNNARLASFSAYHELVPAFEALLGQEGGDLDRFFERVRRLAELPAEGRRRELAAAAGGPEPFTPPPPSG